MNQNEKVQHLRTKFLNKLESLDSDIFHPADVNRVKTNDHYLQRFLTHHDMNVDSAFNMLWEACEWRKKFGTNDINESNVNHDILESGSFFPYGKDKDGKTLLVFKSKKHFKGVYDFEDHKRCLVYWLERLERQDNGDKISLFFDMDGAGLGNMDMDYTKYLISLFNNYYPNFLNYIIIFEMAWVLSTVFKVIKSLLPPKAVEKMKFINKSSSKDYVDMERALKSWGGKEYYVYHFEPEAKTTSSLSTSGEDNRKKVHFADVSFKPDQLDESGFEEPVSPVPTLASTSVGLATSDVLVFTNEGSECRSSIILKNEDAQAMSYKIKTTSPEKFRVRPSTGVLASGARASVSVVLLPGYHVQSLQTDKFLVMSIPIEYSELSQQEVNDLWKQIGDKDVHQHKIQCTLPQIASNGTMLKSMTDDQMVISKLRSDVTKLNVYANSLKDELKLIRQQQWIIIVTSLVLICSLSYAIYLDYLKSHSAKENCWADPASQD